MPTWVRRMIAPPLAPLFFVAYVVAGGFGQGLAIIPGISITFWPPAGIFLATLLLTRPREWGWFIAVGCAAELVCNAVWFKNPVPFALLYFGANVASAVTGAVLTRRVVGGVFRFESIEQVGAFSLLGAGVAPAISATIIATIDHVIGKHQFTTSWPLVWLGDSSGILVSAPLTFAAVDAWRARRNPNPRRAIEAGVALLVLIGIATAAFQGIWPSPYLAMPPLLWMAARFQLRGAAVAIATLALLGAIFTRWPGDAGAMSRESIGENVVRLQAFLGISAISGIFVGMLSEQKHRALRELAGINSVLDARVRERTATLAASEERLRLALDAADLGSWDADLSTGKAVWNRRHSTLLGAGEENLEASIEAWRRRVHPADLEQVDSALDRALRERTTFTVEHRLVSADSGQERWLALFGRYVYDEAGRAIRILGVSRDVTDRKRAEEAVRAGEERLRLFVAQAPVAVAMLDKGMHFMAVSGRWMQDYGLKGDILGLKHYDVFPDLPQRWKEIHRRALDGAVQRSEDDEFPRANGPTHSLRWEVRPWRYDSGEIGGLIIFSEDITQRKRAEQELRQHREQLEELVRSRTQDLEESHRRLRLSERMASLGTLSAGLGHDMGNLLMPMQVRLETLESLPLPPQAGEEITALRSSLEYLRRLAAGLRLLALDPHKKTSEESTGLSSWWAEAEPILRNALPRVITLQWRSPDEDLRVSMPRAALTQAVFNLVQNAGEAMRAAEDGAVRISAERAGGSVRISVADSGPGMSEAVRARCMEPFFTTKTRGVSTGLGLSLVYGLTSEAGGSVEIDSHEGVGTTFTLVLPEAVATHATCAEPGRRVIVDVADARVRAFLAAELRSLRFDVQFAPAEPADGDITVRVSHEAADAHGNVIALPAGARLSEMRTALRRSLTAAEAHRP